ncbi:AP2 domain-containing protein [Salmonella enterica subsp. enterica serovar Newport]|nr:AP2 domain-containing protein [Salmonella enterica subsp. enterica serovar Newport]
MTKKLVYGVGHNDMPYGTATVNGKATDEYSAWSGLLQRAYDPKYHVRNPTYVGCSVVEEWHFRSKFVKWFGVNYVKGWCLDKDILNPGNKVYGPDTCIYVPVWINTFANDSGAIRGGLPIGVSLNKTTGKYLSQCKSGGKVINLGYYDDPKEAHEVWLRFKLNLVLERKKDMDSIDHRIYPNLVHILQSK